MTTPVRRRPAPLRATVQRTERVSPHLQRLTVSGEDFARFRWPGPAGHLKLMLPDPQTGEIALPQPDADGMVVFDRASRLTMRTYTARRFDPETLELDLDVVLHGDGPAAGWAATAQPGDPLAVSVPRSAGFTEDSAADWVVIAGDTSALPAIATIVPAVTRPLTVLIEVDDPADQIDLGTPVTWIDANGAPGDALERAVLGLTHPAGRGQVWVATEAAVVRRIRAGLLERLDRTQLTTRGYWRAGTSNHPDHDFGEDD